MIHSFKKILKNPYFIISIIYLMSNIFLLLLSGCWWDDWTFMTHDLTYVNEVASQSGRPEWNLLIPMCWSLANNGRILIFVLFYFDAILIYKTLKRTSIFNENECLFLTLLFIVIPVDDAKLLISNFPYDVGMFLFYFSCYLFIKKQNDNVLIRILNLTLFFASFILTSLLSYYYVIFIYLFLTEFKIINESNKLNRIFISLKNVLSKNIDYFVLPFIFLFINKFLFMTTGDFSARSSITIEGIVKAFAYIPLSIISIFKSIFGRMLSNVTYVPLLVLLLLVCFVTLYFTKDKETKSKGNNLMYILAGLVILFLGLFVYAVIRKGIINCVGVKGRDAILTPLGISLILYYSFNVFNIKIRNVLCSLFIILGIISTNQLYIEWQKDYYYQLCFEKLIDNQVISDNDTFFVADLNESDIEGQRYYTLNINAYHVFNNQNKLFIPKVSNLYMLSSMDYIEESKTILNGSHMMKDYNPDDLNIDAILVYKCNFDWADVLKIKYYELFKNNEFVNAISSSGDLDVVEVDDSFTSLLIEKAESKEIINDFDVVELLKVYYNY